MATKTTPISELKLITKGKRVELYRDPRSHIHVYYDGIYRFVMSAGFFRDAEASFHEADGYLEIRQAGIGIIRIPLKADLQIWPEIIGEE